MSRAERLFEGFQGRKVRSRKAATWAKNFPTRVWPQETLARLDYLSDKRDPGDPVGEGAQGYWKHFTHGHGPDVTLYTYEENSQTPIDITWPTDAIWLGKLKEVEFSSGEVEIFRGYSLWSFDDEMTLMAVQLADDGIPRDIFFIRGGSMRVEPRGIVL